MFSITARVTKLGRNMAFADITMTAAVGGGGGDAAGGGAEAEADVDADATEVPPAPLAAHATTVYALLA